MKKRKTERGYISGQRVWAGIALRQKIRYNFHIENSMIHAAACQDGYAAAFCRERG